MSDSKLGNWLLRALILALILNVISPLFDNIFVEAIFVLLNLILFLAWGGLMAFNSYKEDKENQVKIYEYKNKEWRKMK